MIKIDTSDSEKWKEIEINHSKWYWEKVEVKLNKTIELLENIDDKELLKFIEIFEEDKAKKKLEKYKELLKDIKEKGGNFSVLKCDGLIKYAKKFEEIELKDLIDKIPEGLKKNNIEKTLYKEIFDYDSFSGKPEDLYKKKIKNLEKKINYCIENHSKAKPNKEIIKLINYFKLNGEDIIPELKEYQDALSSFRENLKDEEKLKEVKNKWEKIKNKIDKIPQELKKNRIENTLYKGIFDYDSFSKKSEGWNRHILISMMGISVCPYCQRQYITNYKGNAGDEEDNRTTADLDHFISKSKYPILALCLYNFIPSCQICNSRFKGQKDSYKDGKLQVLYPYEESYDNYGVKFKTSIELLENIIGGDKEFEVKIDSFQLEENSKKSKEKEVLSIEKRITNDIDMFGLNKVYKDSHNGYLKNMLKTIEKTPESYLNIISELFIDEEEKNKEEAKKEGKLKQKLKQSFKEIIKEPYKFKIRNGEPLGKLTKDIAEEFGIDMGEE